MPSTRQVSQNTFRSVSRKESGRNKPRPGSGGAIAWVRMDLRLRKKTVATIDALAKECRLGRSAIIRWMVETMLKTPRAK